ncbi:MAG: hypothetical protein JWO85_2795 [Candidatus Eremiobacteraeota bacterium]|jgi:hypothetical protein|nr:hypothetical protein [Candidatus Eremiobacteraeota bacterium]
MRVPTAEELAAIAAAYLSLSRATASEIQTKTAPSRWRLAGRLPVADAEQARSVERATSRWSVAGRLDD